MARAAEAPRSLAADIEHPGALPGQRRAAAGRRILLVAGALAAFAGAVALLALASAHGNAADSDAATALLEGQAMAHGHLILHGWRLASDPFWSIDDLFYLVASVVVGVRPVALYLVPAVIAALVVAAGILIAAEGRSRAGGMAGAVTVVALLAFPTYMADRFFVKGPFHIGTALFALAAFFLLRDGRFGWRWALAVLLLAAGLIGDLMMVAYGVVPALLGGAGAAARRRSWRAAATTSGAAAAAVALAAAGHAALSAAGGFVVGKTGRLPHLHQMVHNLGRMLVLCSELLGATWRDFGTGGVPDALAWVRVVPAVLVAACTLLSLVMLVSQAALGRNRGRRVEGWHLDDLLAIATFGPLVTYVVLSLNGSAQWARYLTASVIFASVLTGRRVAAAWERLDGKRPAPFLAAAGLGVTSCVAAGTFLTLQRPSPSLPETALARFLVARHFTLGAGDFWIASVTTVASGGQVRVRPVEASPGARFIERPPAQTAASWYGPHQPFQFLAYEWTKPWGRHAREAAVKSWGLPSRTYYVGHYAVVTWARPVELPADRIAGVTKWSPELRR